jgi:hypothetical protein
MQVSVKELQFKISHVANYKLQGLNILLHNPKTGLSNAKSNNGDL